MMRAVIRSTGSYLPEKILTNADLEKMVDTTDEWIVQRSGIKERRIAAEAQTTGDMAIEAAKAALKDAGLTGKDIDSVIVATTTPDRTFPAVAVKVQNALGIPPCPAFDVQAVCTGFVYALAVANSFILTKQAKRILVIGAEKMSSVLDWTDRTTCVLFADGAGAVILEADESGEGTVQDRGIISTHLYANGAQQDLLYADQHIKMQGREVFKYAVQYMADVVREALEKNNIQSSDVDWLVPHQANIRIIQTTAEKLDMPMEKVVVTVDRHGNTSAASIPLALHDAVSSGKIKKGQLLLLEAMGGGFTWGSALVRF
jgi:3-oxoacyl-[acyl-carrier-protein] synthase III